jgi:DNA-binding HxlR family transcriptional regulator
LLLSLDRQDRLETAAPFVGWLEGERRDGRLEAHSREMLLRALRAASDPVNFAILSELDTIEPVELPDLMQKTGLHRVAVSERLNDLVQTGLAVREMINDQIRGTDLSHGLVAWIEEIASGCGSQLSAELAGREQKGTVRKE